MRFVVYAAIVLSSLAGCASDSGIVPLGSDTYMINKQAATGFPGIGNLKAEVFREAVAQCTVSKKQLEQVSYSETQPPYILGNYPRVDLTFRCR